MSPPLSICVKRLAHGRDMPVPTRMSEHASGCDICAAIDYPVKLEPGKRAVITTGMIFEIPRGYEVQIRPRSGLAAKHGITLANAPGTIDADYRGEVKVILINLGEEPFEIRRGERIAQAVPARVAQELNFIETDALSDTARGEGGFGHSGV